MIQLRKLIKEPLLHFLVLGGGLFILFNAMNADTVQPPNQIVISQGQVKELSEKFSQAWMREPNSDELQSLVNNQLRDEVYYREAIALGLDKDDRVIRRRLRQKLNFIFEDTATLLEPTDEELTSYLVANPQQFRIAPQVSFTHVYLSTDLRNDIDADSRAILTRLKNGASPEEFGDSIMLNNNYTLATQDNIERNFGINFSESLLQVTPGEWVGPIASSYGVHLVKVSAMEPGRLPDLADIKPELVGDWRVQRAEKLKEETFIKLLENYEVTMPATLDTSVITLKNLSPASNVFVEGQVEEKR